MAEPAPYSNPGMSNLLTPDQIARNRKLGETLMMQGMSTEPVGHWTQGLARVLQAGVGRSHMTSADEAQQARQQAMMGALQSSPTFAGLSPGDRAMMGMGPDMMRSILPSVFAHKLDPSAGLRRQALEEDIRHKREMHPITRATAQAQLEALRQKDAMDQFIIRQLSGGQQPAGPAAPQLPIQPQSFAPDPARPAIAQAVQQPGESPPGDPMLIQTQAAPGLPQTPQLPAQSGQPDPIVQTPAGPMPASQARKLGFLLAYKGKGDAGKMIADPADPTKLPKEALNEIGKTEINLTEQLGRMREITRQFRPEFLTLEEQGKQYAMSWLDSFDTTRSNLTPDQIKQMSEYTGFRRDTVDNLNRYIKEITGAAMGVEEAKRIISAMPSMNDSPTQFLAKAKAAQRAAELAVARTRYLRQYGFNGQPWNGDREIAARAVPLERMKGIILEDGKQVRQQIKQQFPEAGDDQINGAVRAHIRSKYGMDI